ncbi:hypothetical protein L1049_004191 [Liquidambar formosana]|uniref:UV-B-induced protein At3g17800, chloroplastic-like n=1 Tax=Liquidambar formosana TaxID=63359 RepID=A0AAP0RMY6_LIQFO
MDYSLSYNKIPILQSLPSRVKYSLSTVTPSLPYRNFPGDRRLGGRNTSANCTAWKLKPKPFIAVASAGASHCEFSSLNTPLEPRSSAGKLLSSVLQNQRELFHVAAAEQLKQLADDRDAAVTRMLLSSCNTEACLHRKIAELKEQECQIAIEDVMYMFVFYKFSEIRVHLVPKLSRCIYNGRLEIWPSKDWELESIHSFEVLEMIREHITTVIGLRANSSVTDNWATTKILRLQLGRIYAASILYGYFLKSASLRHHLEASLSLAHQDLPLGQRTSLPFPEFCPCELNNLALGGISSDTQSVSLGQGSCRHGEKLSKLRCYVMGFDPETLQRCAKLKSKEAVNLIEKHSSALFGDEKTGLLEIDEVISTSFASLKRMVLEAITFGSFLWDAEEFVGTLYKLKDN